MRDRDRVFELRKRLIDDWRYRRLSWQEIVYKYGVSKAWFYSLRRRFLKHGYEALKDRKRNNSNRPHRIAHDQKEKILEYVYDNPTHGPDRIARELGGVGCTKTVWNMLKKEGLNTRRKRRFWAEDRGKPVLTKKEQQVRSAKHNHIESHGPGELISMDTFWCNIKDLRRIYQYTACDIHSSYGWAKVYIDKTADNSIDFFSGHILKNVPDGKIKRVLTDQGVEFYSSRHGYKFLNHCFTEYLARHGIIHSVTKVAHPWTNGYAERLNQTIWEEFYLCRLTKPYFSIETLNKDLQDFMRYYNFKRMHSGYKLIEGGYKCPGHAFYDIKERDKTILIEY